MKKLNKDGHSEYIKDESKLIGSVEEVYLCESSDDCEWLIQYAYEHKKSITFQGGLTGLCGGAVPMNGIVANTSPMNKFLGMSIVDNHFILHLESGTTLEEINKMLQSKKIDTSNWSFEAIEVYKKFKKEDLFFPNDPTETLATIGGIIACEASGANSFKYGSVRDYVMSITVITGRGKTVIERGKYKLSDVKNLFNEEIKLPELSRRSKSTKDVAGIYFNKNMDLIDLFIGSEGLFGFISEVKIKLLKKPQQVVGVQLFLESENHLVEFVDWLRNDSLLKSSLVAIEYFDSNALALLKENLFEIPELNQFNDISSHIVSSIYVEFHYPDAMDIEPSLIHLTEHLESFSVSTDVQWISMDETDYQKLKSFRHAVPEAINQLISIRQKDNDSITKIGTDFSVPDHRLEEVIQMYKADLKKAGLYGIIFGHIGDNHLHVNIIPNTLDEYNKGWKLMTEWAYNIVSMNGSVTAEHGVGKLKKPLFNMMFDDNDIISIRSIKKVFDPLELFNKGSMID